MTTPLRLTLASLLVSLAGAAPPARPELLGLAHVSLYVHDIAASRAFYENFLDFEEPFSLSNPDGSLSMAFVKVNDRQFIELAPEKSPASDRLNHIAFETSNADALRLYLASRGIPVPLHTPVGRIGNANFTVKDPDGHTVEFVQYLPSGWTARDRGLHLGPHRVSQRILHAGILVGNLDRSLAFYSTILGLREFWRGSSDNKTLSWVNLRLPDGSDYIELMLYRSLPPETQRGTAHHLCLETPDIAAAVASLQSRASSAAYSRPIQIKTGVNRKRQANLFDPDGTRTELMEPATVDGQPAPSSPAPPPVNPAPLPSAAQ